MNWKWLPIIVGGLLLLPILSWGAESQAADQTSSGIFKPVPEGQEPEALFTKQNETAGEVFGGRHDYIHPFLSVGGYYTSNLFNTNDNEKSDTVLTISPGIWFALPGARQQLLRVETLNTAPGGLEISRFRTESDRRFQGYALFRGDFERHNKYSEADTNDQRGEALLQYNASSGLSLELADVYIKNHDAYSTGDAAVGQLDKYKSNWLNPTIDYQLSPKTRLRLNYSLYVLDYDAARRSYRDRTDQIGSGYVFYRFASKTSAFLNYQYINVAYDTNKSSDNHENLVFAGLQWKATEKTRGRIQAGYGQKKFDSTSDTHNFFAVEIQGDYRFTPKTSMYLRATRRLSETDIQGVRNVLTHRIRLGYIQNITPKLTGRVTAHYYRDKYDGEITVGTLTAEPKDKYYGGELALGLAPRRWLNLSAGYAYRERDSNFNNRDYQNHTGFLNVTVAL